MNKYLAIYSLEVLETLNYSDNPEAKSIHINKIFGIKAPNEEQAKKLATKAKLNLERFLYSSRGTIVGVRIFPKGFGIEDIRETGSNYAKVLSVELTDIFKL
ncbi:MAG: hypothetical protein AABY03_01110, partial [Nanoarchaeota archaeon]